jgi:hypothetical protein
MGTNPILLVDAIHEWLADLMNPSPDPWPCSVCAMPGWRNLGVDGFCLAHWSALLTTFNPKSFPPDGLMIPTGASRGDGWYWCTCVRCGATDICAPMISCPWCERSIVDDAGRKANPT